MGLLSNIAGFVNLGKSGVDKSHPVFRQIIGVLGQEIAHTHDFHKRLFPAIASAEAYFDEQIALIPGPIDIDTHAYFPQSAAAALFPSLSEISCAIGRSLESKDVLPLMAQKGNEEAYALMGFRCKERDQLPGKALFFADHSLKCLATDEATTRQMIRAAANERLLKNFSEHLEKLREKGRLLIEEWNIENETARSQRLGDGKQMVFAEHELVPENILRGLIAWLGRPYEHFGVLHTDIRIAERFDVPMLHAADRRQWIVCLVKFPLHEGLLALAQEGRVHRYIFI